MKEVSILVVEDEAIVADDLRVTLEGLGYTVLAAVSSGEEAIQTAVELQPNLVLMDIGLKGDIDGIEAAEKIRIRCDIPVVFLTAFADDETLRRAKVTEPFGYLLKPFKEQGLHSTIEMALHKHELEVALRESEKRYRLLAENVSDVIWTTDMSLQLTYISPSVTQLRGYSVEEALTQTMAVRLTPTSLKAALHVFEQLAAARSAGQEGESGPRTLELEFTRKDGSSVWTEVKVSLLRDPAGRPTQFLGVTRDITARKEAETALRESERQLRSIFNNAAVGIVLVDLNGRFTEFNDSWCSMLGHSREELVNLTVQDVAPVGETALLSSGHQWSDRYSRTEERYRRKDGSEFWGDLCATVIHDQEGNAEGLVGIVVDVTERMRVKQALQQHNRNLALLTQVSQALTATLDLPEVLERLLRAAVEITNAEGSSVWLWDEQWAGSLACHAILLDGEYSSPRDLRLHPGQGIAGWVAQSGKSAVVTTAQSDVRFFPGIDQRTGYRTSSILAAPLRMRDHISGVLEVVNKLTDSPVGEPVGFDTEDRILTEMLADSAAIAIENARLIEALRKYGIELETRNQDLDAFAHTVAHDLKNPLGHMVGYAELLEEDAAEMQKADLRRYLHTIAQNGRKMSNIIDELLLFASVRKLDDVTLMPLEMADIVSEAQHRLADLIQEYQAEIILPDTWPMAMGHGPWVEEIWVNYLGNAIRYGGQPPRLELGATKQEDGDVRFWVRDNGPGLTPEEQSLLFIPFTRFGQVRAKGHGLGLSIVRRIVKKLGGQYGVESKVNEGSTFSFTLPTALR